MLKRVARLALLVVTTEAAAQPPDAARPAEEATLDVLLKEIRDLKESQDNRQHTYDVLLKAIDDVLWRLQLADVAEIDKVTFTGPPPRYQPNPTAQGAGNPLILRAYTIFPKNLDRTKKHPLLVFPHQGIHANFDTRDGHVVRELIAQGYVVVAPEYRGLRGEGALAV